MTVLFSRRFSVLLLLAGVLSLRAETPPSSRATAAATEVAHRTIYVAPQGNDDHDGCTPGTALRTPQHAADISEPGDVISFTPGEYEAQPGATLLQIRRSGEPGKPITYASAPGGRSVLRSKGAWEVIKVLGARHINIRGFRVIGDAGSVALEEATREANNLKNPRTCGNGIGITSDPKSKTPSAYITVSECEVSDMPGGGIFANHADYLTFENNVVYRCAFWSPYGNSGISVYQPTAIDESTDYKIFIRNNVCFENYQNIPFYFSNKADPSKRKVTDGNGIIIDDYLNTQAWGGGSGKEYKGRTLVINNVVFANGGSGIHSYKSCNVDILHNYAADNNRHPALHDGQIFAMNSKNMRILNNILIAPVGKPVSSDQKNQQISIEGNIYANLDGTLPILPGPTPGRNIVSAPHLILTGWREGGRNYQAAPDSPARAAGISLTRPEMDFFGNPRDTQKPDIGPFALPGVP